MAIFAGDIPGALLRIPGTPASAAYVEDAYRMTRAGQAELALGVASRPRRSAACSAPPCSPSRRRALAEFALNFSSLEYFWLALLRPQSCAVFVSTDAPIKGVVSLLIGLFIATDRHRRHRRLPALHLRQRRADGRGQLHPGHDRHVRDQRDPALRHRARRRSRCPVRRSATSSAAVGRVLWRYGCNIMRGNVIGVVIGILPGAGADIAAWISYAVAKRFSKEPERFGHGHIEGAGRCRRRQQRGARRRLGPGDGVRHPGDSITAIVIGVLYMKNMNPGPTILLHAPELLYAVFIMFFVANVLMMPLGYAAIRLSRQILHVPRDILMPVILIFCIVGAFAINNTRVRGRHHAGLGVLGFVMEENGFPIAPTILGIVLGRMVEENFMTSMIKSNGICSASSQRPIAAVLGAITLVIWAWVIVGWGRRAWRGRRDALSAGSAGLSAPGEAAGQGKGGPQ